MGEPRKRNPFRLTGVQLVSDELVRADQGAVVAVGGTNHDSEGRCLSAFDVSLSFIGQYGGIVVLPGELQVPLLREALGEALGDLPWLAGRLVHTQGGRSVDVRCTNGGARLVALSCSTPLDALVDELRAVSPYGNTAHQAVQQLLMRYWHGPLTLPRVIKDKLPLALGLVVRLGGGSGTVLAVAVHHSLVDFDGLQTFVAHWAAAYNRRLLKQQGQQGEQQHEQVQTEEGANSEKATQPKDQESAGQTTVVAAAAAAAGAPGQAHAHATVQLAASTLAAAGAAAARGTASSAVLQGSHTPTITATASPASADAPTATITSSSPGGGPLLQVPPSRRRPVLSAALLEGQASDAPLPPGVPAVPSETIAATPLVVLRVVLYFLWHSAIRGGGLQSRLLYVSAARLAELKAQALEDLRREQQQRGTQQADGGGLPSWVSTNDALVGRITQVLHRLPLRRRHPMSFHVPVNMRGAKRLPPGDGSFPQLPSSALGNPLHVLPFTDTQPAGSSLGCMAGMVRTSLEDRHLVPQFRHAQAGLLRDAQRYGMNSTSATLLARQPWRNGFNPTGPLLFSNWEVDYSLWQFGPAAPVVFIPCGAAPPSCFQIYPEPPAWTHPGHQSGPAEGAVGAAAGQSHDGDGCSGGGCESESRGRGGVFVMATLHGVCWKQLEQAVRDGQGQGGSGGGLSGLI